MSTQQRQEATRLMCEWRRIGRTLADPAVELDSDELSAVLEVYTRLQRLGAKIDVMADGLIRQLMYQLADREARV